MRFVVALAAVLVVYNNATNLGGLPDSAYVPTNLAAAALLLAWSRAAGYGWGTVGLGRGTLAPGVRWGAVGVAVVAVALVLASVVPWAQPLLADQRVAGITRAELAWRTLVRIPLGTVLFEELAFRGALLGTWAHERSVAEALVGSSVLFGLWHIGPTVRLLEEHAVAVDSPAAVAGVAAAVVATAGAGVLFGWLRLRTGGVLAPALVHLAANSLGTVAAFLAQR